MELPQVQLPAAVPAQKMRPVQATIPPTMSQRETVRRYCRQYIEAHRPVPPMPLDELRVHAEAILAEHGIDAMYLNYIAVTLNNEMWREDLAGIPYERRLLLLPKCLRVEATCPAPFDEFGLLCKQCGQCSIQDLQEEAERMGYAVLVAEGSAIVMSIIETGKIDAIVGVSCLSVLEKAFPYMESAAIPGIAIPLLQDDCADTNVDLDSVWEVLHLTSDDRTHRLDLDGLREQVAQWFSEQSLDELLGEAATDTQRIARQWLARDGKRWRPFLAVCAFKAMCDDPTAEVPDDFKRIAVAVECFHKASLIHDDIEDDDATRYDQPTLHMEHGMAVALNVGDLMLGDGYRLIADSAASAEAKAKMLSIAAAGHRTLCLGQGAELCWARDPKPLKSTQVLDIFSKKTAPAFEVALRLGAAYAGADNDTHDALTQYSESLGIAYQIRDDMEDWLGGEGTPDSIALRPTLMASIAWERTHGDDKQAMEALWRRDGRKLDAQQLRNLFVEAGVHDRAQRLLDSYKEQALRSLRFVEQATLKGLLRRVMTKIFNDLVIEGWCREFEAANASGRKTGAESAA